MRRMRLVAALMVLGASCGDDVSDTPRDAGPGTSDGASERDARAPDAGGASDGGEVGDASDVPRDDADAPRDAATLRDGSIGMDGATAGDGGGERDARTDLDAGSGVDARTSPDASSGDDAAPGLDASSPVDAAGDAGGATDAATSGDAASTTDAATSTDAGGTTDAGSTDAGVAPRPVARASVATGGVEADRGGDIPAVSADGRFVAFASLSRNLVAGDTNDAWDTFVHDRTTGVTTRVSVSSSGAQGNRDSGHRSILTDPSDPSISADGRFVAFSSDATNLVTGDTNGRPDVFVHDRTTGQTTRVSVSTAGVEGNGGSHSPQISGDGRIVAFTSHAETLVAGDGNRQSDVFVHDRMTATTTRVSVDPTGAEVGEPSALTSISGDGRLVVFESRSALLVAGDTNTSGDVFVRDRDTGTTTRASVGTGGTEASRGGGGGRISANGRYVLFHSTSRDLVVGGGMVQDVFVHDRLTFETTLVSYDATGTSANGLSTPGSISDDGRFVAFESYATDLVTSPDLNTTSDVFLRDRTTATTACVSVTSLGATGSSTSDRASISADGSVVVFASYAVLLGGDGNFAQDVFVVPLR